MVLHAEGARIDVADPLARAVVEMHVRDFAFAGERIAIDTEAVVLGGHFDASRREILHGLIETSMAELQLVGASAQRQAKYLVPETDSEQRTFADQSAHRVDGVRDR